MINPNTVMLNKFKILVKANYYNLATNNDFFFSVARSTINRKIVGLKTSNFGFYKTAILILFISFTHYLIKRLIKNNEYNKKYIKTYKKLLILSNCTR